MSKPNQRLQTNFDYTRGPHGRHFNFCRLRKMGYVDEHAYVWIIADYCLYKL
jgi:hypothetical protein